MKLTEDRFLIFIFLLNGFMFYMQSLTAFGLMSLISPVTFRYGFINYFLPVIINSLQSKAICHNNDSIPNSHQKMALLYRLSFVMTTSQWWKSCKVAMSISVDV